LYGGGQRTEKRSVTLDFGRLEGERPFVTLDHPRTTREDVIANLFRIGATP